MNPKVDEFLSKTKKWKDELTLLREIILDCGLYEDFKWKHPCYTDNDKNIVLIHGFKEYCALLFMKGSLLSDEKGILIQQTENVQSGRQIRFTSLKEITKLKSTLKAYIFEAIEVEKAGIKIEYKKADEFDFPDELTTAFKKNKKLQPAWEKLTPGRQKGYLLHFTGSKNSATRESRIEKNIPRILGGFGFNDCICGLSKRKPNCDGSHKLLEKKK